MAARRVRLGCLVSDLARCVYVCLVRAFNNLRFSVERGEVLGAESIKTLGSEWGRYRDLDGDGIPYRTLPGTSGPAYFTRGSGHNERGQYSERPDDYQNNVDRLARKYETAKKFVPQPIVEDAEAEVGSWATGSVHWLVGER